MASSTTLLVPPWRLLAYSGLALALASFFVDLDVRPSHHMPGTPRRFLKDKPFQKILRHLQPKPKYQILCYGDSLTNGNHEDDREQGYCPYEKGLQDTLDDTSPPNTYEVDHIGLAGKEARAMVKWHETDVGLTTKVKKMNPDVVIILAGTNDLPKRVHQHKSPDPVEIIQDGVDDIMGNLLELHNIAKKNGAIHTIAVGIPQSILQEKEPITAEMAGLVDEELQRAADESDDMTFVPFPFPYDKGPNWSKDGIHPTCDGYYAFGRAMASVVEAVLEAEG